MGGWRTLNLLGSDLHRATSKRNTVASRETPRLIILVCQWGQEDRHSFEPQRKRHLLSPGRHAHGAWSPMTSSIPNVMVTVIIRSAARHAAVHVGTGCFTPHSRGASNRHGAGRHPVMIGPGHPCRHGSHRSSTCRPRTRRGVIIQTYGPRWPHRTRLRAAACVPPHVCHVIAMALAIHQIVTRRPPTNSRETRVRAIAASTMEQVLGYHT